MQLPKRKSSRSALFNYQISSYAADQVRSNNNLLQNLRGAVKLSMKLVHCASWPYSPSNHRVWFNLHNQTYDALYMSEVWGPSVAFRPIVSMVSPSINIIMHSVAQRVCYPLSTQDQRPIPTALSCSKTST